MMQANRLIFSLLCLLDMLLLSLLCSYHLPFSSPSLPPKRAAGESLVGVQLLKPRQPFCHPKLVVFTLGNFP